MGLRSGTQLGPYEILSAIGAGGMGEVYRAHDGRLNRDVALKVLPEIFAADPDRMVRFEREARVLGALNHPNIAAIYGLEEFGSGRALVMELVEGETLADRVSKGPIPLDEALPIAKQMAEALEYAHDRGVVHRDLKPANIKVTADGTVKVLDFGLAKALMDEPVAADPRDSPTLSMNATLAGAILGTAAYMSPEQAKGKPVDRRADIWAFGVVLFEMLTGKQLFGGETAAEIVAAVMMKEPALEALPKDTPTTIRNLLRRCLEKNLRQRLQHVGEARILIEATIAEGGPQAQAPSPIFSDPKYALRTIRLAWSVAVLAGITALVLAFVHFGRTREEGRILKFPILPPNDAGFNPRSIPAVSPDGLRVAFVATVDGKDGLWVRDLESIAARLLPGTEGVQEPFWSPDSRFIGFFASGKLKKIGIAGGPAVTLCDATGAYGGSWSKNDVILFSPSQTSGLFRVPAAGASATAVTELDKSSGEITHRFPWFLPDGRHFLYTARSLDADVNSIYVGDLVSKSRRRLLRVSSNAVYVPPGYLLYLHEQTLMAQSFDAQKVQLIGDPIPIAEQVASNSGGIVTQGQFSASQNGVVVYASGGAGGNLQLTWFDRSGRVMGTVGPPGFAIWPAISPDGNTVAVDRIDSQTGYYDVWLHDLVRSTDSRFTFNSKTNRYPVWSPNGDHIAFSSFDGIPNIYQKAVTGTSLDEPLDRDERTKRPDDWSRDGRYIIEEVNDPKTGHDIWVLPLFGDRKPFPYLRTEFNEHFAKLSPNGRWLVYVSNETRRDEVYVQSFPMPGGKWQVSTNGGDRPVWGRDGKELFFIGPDQKLMAVDVKDSSVKFEMGVPKTLFQTHVSLGVVNTWFDVSKDGRFLIPTLVEQASSASMTVVVNWTAGLKK